MAANASRKSSKGRKSSSTSRSGDGDGKRKSGKGASASRREDAGGAGRQGTEGRSRKGGEGGARKGGEGARKSAAKRGSRARSDSAVRGAQERSDSAGGDRKRASRGASARGESGGSRSRKSAAGRGRMDALKLLKEDHERVDEMFKKYDRMKEGDDRKQALLETILEELRVHAQVEEEIFYPALDAAFEGGGKEKEAELIDEAEVEHETVKWLMEQLEGEQSDEHTRDARVKVMGEYVRHHVQEEEGQMFKAARKADVDLDALGRQIDARKRQLKGEEPADQEGQGEEGALQVSEPAAMATTGARTH